MEIVVRNLPDSITEKQVETFFRPVLTNLSINSFHCRKLKNRGFATITIVDIYKAQIFLQLHGQRAPGREHFEQVKQKLYHMKRPISCSKSTGTPDKFLLQSLEREESEKLTVKARKAKPSSSRVQDLQRKFDIVSLHCGHWDYLQGRLVFMTHFQEQRAGTMIFRKQAVTIDLHPINDIQPGHRVEVPYATIESFTIGNRAIPAVTYSLSAPPKLLEDLAFSTVESMLTENMRILGFQKQQPTFKRKRITALRKGHEVVVSSCLCYRVMLQQPHDIPFLQALKRATEIPESISWDTTHILKFDFPAQLSRLNTVLGGSQYDNVAFEVKFQFQRLAQMGYLPPAIIVDLFRTVYRTPSKIDHATMIAAIRKLSNHIPFAGPETEASDLSVKTLSNLLTQYQELAARELLYSNLAEKYEHIALVHKVSVTPVGLMLSGPEPEVINRVLRKYSTFSNYFIQVSFQDEDGEPIRYNREVSNQEIYRGRFKKVLEGVINIAGRGYEFLGFSHSSLRSQTCWFMAPFTLEGELLHARLVISRLGKFDMIRSPAKCAARIGQAFSQTFSSINLPPEAIQGIPDIKRNGRVFSDGVGTCSVSVMEMIWKEYTQSQNLKPTVFQVRFRGDVGAKGMISLDSTLKGDVLRLRPSMIKFEGPGESIEICGAGLKPLPMYLNRQIIKILEDLGVSENAFLDLQATAVEKLRVTTESPINAANFLQRNHIGKAARLPWLIRKLLDLDIFFNDDDFLRNTLELAVLIQLRELKHRSRILVEQGLTLYGIMDETGFLQEGQVYCPVQDEKESNVLTGSVVVTRSPALHPGDIQVADAVEVPIDSPLRALHNCLVFSSKGERDLPSQLSGGDLDGDLYNIIYLDSLYPRKPADPADYPIAPPLDIRREVVRADMTTFFISFMENDQLGRIATMHQTVADQQDRGTFHPDCILLASLHSAAVDFSKTGIPVDLSKMPRHSNVRPDFQAPGPRVLIDEEITLQDEDKDEFEDKDDIAETSMPRIRYYASKKVLGKLYRAIDEQQIFDQIQRQSRAPRGSLRATQNALDVIWKYVEKATALIQWHHYEEFAKDVKEAYEENLTDTMINYSTNPPNFISEVEVFCGNILGKNGVQNKRQREFSVSMKDKHERDVNYTVACIMQGNEKDGRVEALERSIACLAIACRTSRVRRKVGTLVSFGWIAAAVCLKEVEKFQGI